MSNIQKADKPKNILFIFTDQQCHTSLGCYGNEKAITPNLDRLAQEGVLFENAYTTLPVCTPARASVQTGLYPFKHGMMNNLYQPGCLFNEIPDEEHLLSRRLGVAGYTASHTGKWHLSYGRDTIRSLYGQQRYENEWSEEHGKRFTNLDKRGGALPTAVGYIGDDFPGHGGGGEQYPQFCQYLKDRGLTLEMTPSPEGWSYSEITSGENTAVDYFLVDRSISLIEELKKEDKPFFHALNFWGPHGPERVPSKYLDPFREMSFEPWESYEYSANEQPRYFDRFRLSCEWPEIEAFLRYHHAYVHYIDAQIGRLLTYLEQEHLMDDTVIIFSSDHGDAQGRHGKLYNKSYFLYEETTHVPLIVNVPGEAEGVRESALVSSTIDIYATILDLAGVAKSTIEETQGRSLMPLVRQEANAPRRESVVTQSEGIEHCVATSRMIRKGSVKYMFHACADNDELFDLAVDPYELNNLAVQPEGESLLKEMRATLEQWMLENEDPLLAAYRCLI